MDQMTKAIEALLQDTAAESDWNGLIWSSKADAQKALKAANAALEAHRSSKPYPEWAVKALAAGWKVLLTRTKAKRSL